MRPTEFKCGFVAVVGPTNSGKSTLVNALVGEKVSIVSKLPQTTYHGIRGVLTTETYQIVFTDTPGFQSYRENIPRLLNRVADRNAEEGDLLLWVFDASSPRVMSQIEKLADKIKKLKGAEQSFLLLNKVDLMEKGALLPMIEQIWQKQLFREIIPISAKQNNGLDRVMKVLVGRLPVGPAHFEPTQKTDRPDHFRIQEYIREKIYTTMKQEIPYCAMVELESWDEPEGRSKKAVPTINVTIQVDSASRKGIMIGKQGAALKDIGVAARKDIEKLVGKQVCLKLHVKVKPDWREDAVSVHRYLEL